jgi:RNA polymerase sigma-70 factor, ECF subfamily
VPPSESAFVELLLQHQHLVQKICRAYCPAEQDRRDLFQEIALQLWRAYPQFRGDSKGSTWLYRIALNVAISHRRRARRPPADALGEATALLATQEPDDAAAARAEQLYQAIHTLSSVEKALVLLYFEEKSNEEIAELMGISVGNVRVKMHRIREKLKSILVNPFLK